MFYKQTLQLPTTNSIHELKAVIGWVFLIEDIKSDMLVTYGYIYNFDVCFIIDFDKSESIVFTGDQKKLILQGVKKFAKALRNDELLDKSDYK